MNPIQVQTPLRSVAVDVADPDLDADVRAILAALSLEARPGRESMADVLVTDAAGVGGAGGSRIGPARVIRVGADGAGTENNNYNNNNRDDDEVLRLPSRTADLVALLSTPVAASGSLVAVVGAVGGCGTSTIAAALAIRAAGPGQAAGHAGGRAAGQEGGRADSQAGGQNRVLLVEADPRGTGIDLLLGREHEPGLRVEDVRSELGGPDPDALWSAVPAISPKCGVLSRARGRGASDGRGNGNGNDSGNGNGNGGGGAVGAALSHRAAGGLVICDVGGYSAEDPVLMRADLVVVVTCSDLRGAVAATDVTSRLRSTVGVDRIHLVVRVHRGDPLYAADIAAHAGVCRWDVLPEMGAVRRLSGSGDLGASLARGRAGQLRRLAGLADAVLAGGDLW